MSETKLTFFIDDVPDASGLFKNVIGLFAKHDPEIVIWGKLPKSLSREIERYNIRGNLIKRIFFKEKHYKLNKNDIEIFVSKFEEHLLKEISWVIKISGVSVVWARAYDDISIYSNMYLTNEMIKNHLKILLDQKIIKDYEIATDPVNEGE